MDEFLIPNANFKRLYEEYKKYGSLAIGVDFDNTIYDYHGKGYSYSDVIDLITRAQIFGNKIYIFTANPDHDKVREFCKEKGILIQGINIGHDIGIVSTKPFYNILLDDRAGLISAFDDLSRLINTLEIERLDSMLSDNDDYETIHIQN